ncbi:MAG: hypothetical protein IT578_11010 [Verrucomicrobiae bacterium]|nr:hypothetical protein [Verrucomicrobiae bacterium]
MNRKKRWLDSIPWEAVAFINQRLCAAGNVASRLNRDAHARAQRLWEKVRRQSMPFRQVIETALQCHRLAPFAHFNGNTFVAITRNLGQEIYARFDPPTAHVLRSAVDHYVAGTITRSELDMVLGRLVKTLKNERNARRKLARSSAPAGKRISRRQGPRGEIPRESRRNEAGASPQA